MSNSTPPPNPYGADALGRSINGHNHGNLGQQAAFSVAVHLARQYGPRLAKQVPRIARAMLGR